MVDFVSKLISADTIVSIVETIEQRIPGWWYCIYQGFDGLIEIRGGPSLESPEALSRRYVMTEKGDTGFKMFFELDATNILDQINAELVKLRNEVFSFMENNDTPFQVQRGLPRVHSIEDFDNLKFHYQEMINTLHKTKHMGFDLHELHIGSCTISADSSIRGLLNGEEVSFQCDVIDGGLGYSLWSSTADLLFNTVNQFNPTPKTTAAAPYSFGSALHPGFAKIVEEIGEALEVIGKITMIGGSFVHWVGNLRKPLHKELADVSAAIDFYVAQPENMNDNERREFFERKMNKIAKFEDWHSNPQLLPQPSQITSSEPKGWISKILKYFDF